MTIYDSWLDVYNACECEQQSLTTGARATSEYSSAPLRTSLKLAAAAAVVGAAVSAGFSGGVSPSGAGSSATAQSQQKLVSDVIFTMSSSSGCARSQVRVPMSSPGGAVRERDVPSCGRAALGGTDGSTTSNVSSEAGNERPRHTRQRGGKLKVYYDLDRLNLKIVYSSHQ